MKPMKKRIPFDECIPFPFYRYDDPYTDEQVRSLFYDSPDPADEDFLYDFDGIVKRYFVDRSFKRCYKDKPVQLVRDHVGKTISAYTCPRWADYPEEEEDQ